MVLFSCMGDNAQDEVGVGVGAIAGSTIMLLTIPWFLAWLGGRVDLDETGMPNYNKKPKFTGQGDAGVVIGPAARTNAKYGLPFPQFL